MYIYTCIHTLNIRISTFLLMIKHALLHVPSEKIVPRASEILLYYNYSQKDTY